MTVKQLIQKLQKYNLTLSDGIGRDNIGEIKEDSSTISILPCKNRPFSSDN